MDFNINNPTHLKIVKDALVGEAMRLVDDEDGTALSVLGAAKTMEHLEIVALRKIKEETE